jgi:pimeloyl-ACP methyl ester carboxylesterase
MAAFESRGITVRSHDGAVLSGVLEIPSDRELRALAIPVHGSFPQTRDGNIDNTRNWMFPTPIPERNLFIDFRDTVIPLGVGTLRYDKRASGSSEGIWARSDFHSIARDLAVVHQRARDLYPDLPIGFMGQSEGSFTFLHALDFGAEPSFLISQGGALESFERILDLQRDRAAKPFLDDPDGVTARQFPVLAGWYLGWFRGDMRDRVRAGDSTYVVHGPDGFACELSLDLMRQYEELDCVGRLESFDGPVLLMNGSEDLNVPPTVLQDIAEMHQEQGRFPHVRCEIMEGLEHSFRRVDEGESFFEAMQKPIDSSYGATIASFFGDIL